LFVSARKSSIQYVGSNLISKGLAAFAQLYAVYVFTKTQTQDDAALIFLLLGYAIWFQMLEFGLCQTLQNKFNSRDISSSRLIRVLLAHYVIMVIVALLVSSNSYLAEILLPSSIIENNLTGVKAFSVGAALLIVASSNTVIQRVLLVINRGSLGNILIISQACIAILGLFVFQNILEPDLILGVLIYLAPQILVYIPLLIIFTIKLNKRRSEKNLLSYKNIIYEAVGFSGIGFLSILFLGSDYYFAAHYLDADEIVSYYLVSRIFFISYVVYYGFVVHKSRRLSAFRYQSKIKGALRIFWVASFVGLLSVGCVYSLAALLNTYGVFDFITHGVRVSQSMLFIGFLYFMVRVVRDGALVIIGALNQKLLLYQAYLIEVVFGLSAMYLLVPNYKEIGIFYALLMACLLSFLFIATRTRRYTKNITTNKYA
jgi:O-antigen/teichoic acid export membrane protein